MDEITLKTPSGELQETAARVDPDDAEDLRESRRFLRATLDALSAHVAVLDEEGRIIAVNESWRRFAEANEGDLGRVGVGVNYLDVCDASAERGVADAKGVAAGLRAVIASRQDTFSLEYPCHSSTETRWFLIKANRMKGEGPVRVVVAHENVTERKRAAQALRHREARMRLLYAVSAQTGRTFDEQLQEALKLTTTLLGLDIGILSRIEGTTYTVEVCYAPGTNLAAGQQFDLGQTYCSIAVEADDVVAIDHMKRSEHRRHPCYNAFKLEAYIAVPIEVHGERYGTINFSSARPKEPPFTEADRDTIQLLCQWVSATLESRQAEALLRGQSNVLELIAQAAPLAQVLEVLVRMIEKQGGESLLASILLFDAETGLLHHGAAPSLPASYNEAIDGLVVGPEVGSCGTAVFRRETIIVTDIAEDPLWADFRDLALRHGLRACWSTPILDTDGRVLGTLAVYYREPRPPRPSHRQLIDLLTRTAAIAIERHRAGQKLKELNESLERRVAERTAELEKTNTTLRRRNRELQDFAYAASHDLQEPLRKIRAFADLMRTDYEDRVDETGRYYLDRMQDGAKRMTRLITDLLALSRVATRGQSFVDVELNLIVSGVLSDLEYGTSETKGRVEVGELPTIEADPVQMRQLFQNVIGNALKFHRPDAPPMVQVTATVEHSDALTPGQMQPLCHITVQDNGIGFDEKYQERIFSPFQRLHGRSEYPGTGIGLALCRRIVERHHGTITATSTPGQGAAFVITLPVGQSGG